MYLQASKSVKQPLYPVENSLIILYNQEILKDILLLANEMGFDRNQMQISLKGRNFKRKTLKFLNDQKNLYRTNFLGVGSIITNDLQ